MARRKKLIEEEILEEVVEDIVEAVPESEEEVLLPHQRSSYSYNVLEDADRADTTKEILHTIGARRKNKNMDFKTMDEIRLQSIPLLNLYVQAHLDTYGIPQHSLIQIIGEEGLGKTSLSLQIAGWAMSVGCPALYIDCESKQMPPHRILRCLSSEPIQAYKMLKALDITRANSLAELEEKLEEWAKVQRGETKGNKNKAVNVPMDTPILAIIDPWGKLMSNDESVGYAEWGASDTSKKKSKAVGEGSNFGHSKFAHGWARRLSQVLEKWNMVVIIVQHQNTKINMATGSFAMIPQELAKKYNKTHIGGGALHQTAAMELILTKFKQAKVGTRRTGDLINVHVEKNSVGRKMSDFYYELRDVGLMDEYDRPGYIQPALVFSRGLAEWLAENKYLDVRVSNNRYTSDRLDIHGVTSDELELALNSRPHLIQELGAQLGIDGYVDMLEVIKENTKI